MKYQNKSEYTLISSNVNNATIEKLENTRSEQQNVSGSQGHIVVNYVKSSRVMKFYGVFLRLDGGENGVPGLNSLPLVSKLSNFPTLVFVPNEIRTGPEKFTTGTETWVLPYTTRMFYPLCNRAAHRTRSVTLNRHHQSPSTLSLVMLCLRSP